MIQTTPISQAASPIFPEGMAWQQQLENSVCEAWKRPFYRDLWGNLEDILHLIRSNQFQELPIVRKMHLRQHWDNIMMFDETTDFVSSSGTTGRPVDIPVNKEQENLRVLRVRRLLRELGVRPGSRVLQLLSLNDLFTLGPLAWQAIKAEGATAIRCTPQRLERVLQAIHYLQPTFVIGNPFTLVRMAEQAGARWPELDVLPKRAFLAVAATFNAQLNPTPITKMVCEKWGFELCINQYGTSELGPVAHECSAHRGLHIHADHHFVELLDLETGKPVTSPDQPGEIIVTGLTTPRGFLPVRYAPGDVATWLRTDACVCGRSTPRLGPIMGRVDHQLKVFGQTVFPDLLLDCADECTAVYRSAVQVKHDQFYGDDVTLLLVPTPESDSEAICQEVTAKVNQLIAITPSIKITTDIELAKLEQTAAKHSNMVKIPRFFDMRKTGGAVA